MFSSASQRGSGDGEWAEKEDCNITAINSYVFLYSIRVLKVVSQLTWVVFLLWTRYNLLLFFLFLMFRCLDV
jgi:hypothetical protein